MFDLPERETASVRFAAELPHENVPWQIGLIVGPSGSGKTTIARTAFGKLAGRRRWPRDRAVVDCFGRRSIKEITAMLTSVGFSSPPAWVKPYHVLSQGEQFRCDLARALLSRKRRIVFDEFTSVVDRTVAKIGTAAVAKTVRRMNVRQASQPDSRECQPGKANVRQFVAVTCHYDVAEWLEPDWVLDMGGMPNERMTNVERITNDQMTNSTLKHSSFEFPSTFEFRHSSFTKGCLRRPPLRLHLHRTTADAWPLFARHHYLSAALNRSAHCYVGLLEGMERMEMPNERMPNVESMTNEEMTKGSFKHSAFEFPSTFEFRHSSFSPQPVAFCAVLSAIGRRGVWRVSRLVVLPDYQGIGIGRAMLAAVAEQYPRLRITTSHPAMLRALSTDPAWQLAILRSAGYTRQPNAKSHTNFRGGAIHASSAGRCVATFERSCQLSVVGFQ
jgi:GNAT superfamily N-acetyltransferase